MLGGSYNVKWHHVSFSYVCALVTVLPVVTIYAEIL